MATKIWQTASKWAFKWKKHPAKPRAKADWLHTGKRFSNYQTSIGCGTAAGNLSVNLSCHIIIGDKWMPTQLLRKTF